MKIRTGIGFDVHRLAEGLPLWLGGIKIEYVKGCVAHSDGDVLVHAICDALLGALALGDIGSHFPDTSDTYKGVDSKKLLAACVAMVKESGYGISNVDSILCMQKPKLMDYIPEMRKVLAGVMGIDIGDLSIKATTTEKLGFEGREEGVSAYATVLLCRS